MNIKQVLNNSQKALDSLRLSVIADLERAVIAVMESKSLKRLEIGHYDVFCELFSDDDRSSFKAFFYEDSTLKLEIECDDGDTSVEDMSSLKLNQAMDLLEFMAQKHGEVETKSN